MKNKRKGVTLMEMTIVLAVIGIISAVVVSFTTMIGQRASVGSGKLNALNEIEMTKAIVEAWVDKVEAAGGSFTVSPEDAGDAESQPEDEVTQITANLTAKIDGSEESWEIVLDLENGLLEASLPDGQKLQCPAESIKSIHFDIQERKEGAVVKDRIIFCTLTYEIPKAGLRLTSEEKTTTFCINSRIGEGS